MMHKNIYFAIKSSTVRVIHPMQTSTVEDAGAWYDVKVPGWPLTSDCFQSVLPMASRVRSAKLFQLGLLGSQQ